MWHAIWFIPFTVINVLVWRFIPCEWNAPYQGHLLEDDRCRK